MNIDYSTNVGKVRMRIGDVTDLPYLSDDVISTVISDSNNNLVQASKICAQYILAQLAYSTHSKMNQLEVWGAESFNNYKQFLVLLVKDPLTSGYAPIPYGAGLDEVNPLIQFTQDWNANYSGGTQSDLLAAQAGWTVL